MLNPDALAHEICRLSVIVDALRTASDNLEILQILNKEPLVEAFINATPFLQTFLAGLNPACDVVVKSVLVIGQGALVFQSEGVASELFEKIRVLIDTLLPVENFYRPLGGIVGYHLIVLKLIAEKRGWVSAKEVSDIYRHPVGLDLSNASSPLNKALMSGIRSLPMLAEIYPVGGAGDRLQLCDDSSGEPLPVAYLNLCGFSLLEWLIRDLQAREYLYYKLTGEQVITPIALMTSHEKRNHQRMIALCDEKKWFGRPKNSFRFFIQPFVPVISEEGNWCLSAPFELIMKPGGHGVMWKLARDEGVFEWLQSQGRGDVLVRQINNPVAGTGLGLLAFTGFGFEHAKAFGFSSCPRAVNSAEGVNILLERRVEGGYLCSITNIEYTDFSQRGIEDIPAKPGGSYSAFPTNTNILFANLTAVEKALEVCPIPGAIINMKNVVHCLGIDGQLQEVKGGRLESTMQNIADYMTDFSTRPLNDEDQSRLKTYITYNERRQTISVTKKNPVPGASIAETPIGCHYDLLCNAHDLLTKKCLFEMPEMPEPVCFAERGPSFLVYLHPALGPMYDVIASKIRGGIIRKGSELILDAAELDMEKISVSGSLLVIATSPLGDQNPDGTIKYSNSGGKCTFKNVVIKNEGVDWSKTHHWWKGCSTQRKEALEIILHGSGEFYAEDVVIKGNYRIEVLDGYRVEAITDGEGIRLITTKLFEPSWFWKYSFDAEGVEVKKCLES